MWSRMTVVVRTLLHRSFFRGADSKRKGSKAELAKPAE